MKEKDTQPSLTERMDKIVDAVQEAFDQLNVPAEIYYNPMDDSAYFSVKPTNTENDAEYEVSEEIRTLPELTEAITSYAEDYDPADERTYYTPGENGTPEEPWLTYDLETVKDTFVKAAEGVMAAKEIAEGKDPSLVYAAHAKAIKEHNQEQCRNACEGISSYLQNLGISSKEIMKAMKEVTAEKEHTPTASR